MAGKTSAKKGNFAIACDYDQMEQAALKLKNFCEPLEGHVMQDVANALPTLAAAIGANGTLARDTQLDQHLEEVASGLEVERQALWKIQADIMSIVNAGRNTEASVKKLVMSQVSEAGA